VNTTRQAGWAHFQPPPTSLLPAAPHRGTACVHLPFPQGAGRPQRLDLEEKLGPVRERNADRRPCARARSLAPRPPSLPPSRATGLMRIRREGLWSVMAPRCLPTTWRPLPKATNEPTPQERLPRLASNASPARLSLFGVVGEAEPRRSGGRGGALTATVTMFGFVAW